MTDPSLTGSFELKFPRELLAQVPKGGAGHRRQDMKVEGWKGSWFSRLLERLVGED